MNERERNLKRAIESFSKALKDGLSRQEYQPQRKALLDAIQAAEVDFVYNMETEMLKHLLRDARIILQGR